MGWIVTTRDPEGRDDAFAQDSRSLGPMQTAFDAEVAAIEGALYWYLRSGGSNGALVIHSDSTSAIARAGHTGAGPGQGPAVRIQRWVTALGRARRRRTVNIEWVKGHAGTPGNERADELAGKAAHMVGTHTIMSLAHIKLRISERFRRRRTRGTLTRTPRHRGDPSPAPEEVHAGQGKELHRSSGGPDQDGPLEIGGVPQENTQTGL
jgi:ribonuclease HI